MDQKQENTPEEGKTNKAVKACNCQSRGKTTTEFFSAAFRSSPVRMCLNGITILVHGFSKEPCWPQALMHLGQSV